MARTSNYYGKKWLREDNSIHLGYDYGSCALNFLSLSIIKVSVPSLFNFTRYGPDRQAINVLKNG